METIISETVVREWPKVNSSSVGVVDNQNFSVWQKAEYELSKSSIVFNLNRKC